MKFKVICLLELSLFVLGQRTTGLDANGNTVVASANAAGAISIISTVGPPAGGAAAVTPVVPTTAIPVTTPVVPAVAVPTTTPLVPAVAATTAAVPAVAATTRTTRAAGGATTTPVGIVQQAPAVVNQQGSLCTTAGCPVPPTLYTVNGVVATFVATTPATPIPTFSSRGSILNLSNYITTTFSASSRLLSGSAGQSMYIGSGWGGEGLGKGLGMVIVVLVGGLMVL